MNIQKTYLADAAAQYRKWLENKGRKSNTVKNHQTPISALMKQVGNIYMHRITPEHLDEMFGQSDWGPQTRNTYMTTLKGFFQWAGRRSYINPLLNPTVEMEPLRVPKEKKVWITPEDFPRLLDTAGEFHPRDRACVAIGLFTMSRASEIRNLQVQDIDFKNNRVSIYGVKTDQHDELPMCVELRDELLTWFNEYRKMTEVDVLDPRWYVIPRFGPMPMIRNTLTNRLYPNPALLMPLRPTEQTKQIYRPVKRALKTLGYEIRGQGIHTLRRSGAAASLQVLRSDGYDRAMGRVQSMLGHASVKTTEIYINAQLDRLERDETWTGKPMFPNVFKKPGLEVIDGGEDRAAHV